MLGYKGLMKSLMKMMRTKMNEESVMETPEVVSVEKVCEEVEQMQAPQEEPMTQECEAPKPKQYMLVVDHTYMAFLSKVMPGLQYVEVEGWQSEENKSHMFLVNPAPKG